jgi:hypothetical protein
VITRKCQKRLPEASCRSTGKLRASVNLSFFKVEEMKVLSLKLGILVLGYAALSDFLSFLLAERIAKAVAGFGMLLAIYFLPPRVKADLIDWIGWSALIVIGVFLINSNTLNALCILLISAYFLSRIILSRGK